MYRFNIAELLENKGVSLRQAERDTGLHFETLRRLANDTSEQIKLSTITVLCEYFEVTPEKLFKRN